MKTTPMFVIQPNTIAHHSGDICQLKTGDPVTVSEIFPAGSTPSWAGEPYPVPYAIVTHQGKEIPWGPAALQDYFSRYCPLCARTGHGHTCLSREELIQELTRTRSRLVPHTDHLITPDSVANRRPPPGTVHARRIHPPPVQ